MNWNLICNVSFETELCLWKGLADSPSKSVSNVLKEESPIGDSVLEIVRLSFGKSSPANYNWAEQSSDDLEDWQQQYLVAIRQAKEELESDESRSKWLCMALNFASFYLDVLLTRFASVEEGSFPENNKVSELIKLLEPLGFGNGVIRLIEICLLSNEHRNVDGALEFGSKRIEKSFSVRSASELLINE